MSYTLAVYIYIYIHITKEIVVPSPQTSQITIH